MTTTKSSSGKRQFILFQILFLLGTVPALAQPPAPLPAAVNLPPCNLDLPSHPAPVVFPCSVIVLSIADAPSDVVTDTIARAGGQTRFVYRSANAAAGVINNQSVLRTLRGQTGIDIIPDREITIVAKPSKAKGGGGNSGGQVVPEGVQRIGAAPGVLPVTGAGVGVAVVDTGIAPHADLAIANSCFDAFDGNCNDGNGHGTHVAGTIAALNNNTDVIGVAPDAVPYAVRVLDNGGSGSDATVMAGLQWIIDNANTVTPAIKVVNLSLGRPGSLNDNPAMRALFQTITSLGISVAVAAGNDPDIEVSGQVPATYPEVMAIAGTTARNGNNQCRFFSGSVTADTASYFTTDGALDGANIGVTVSAPGEDQEDINRGCMIRSTGILSLNANGGTTRLSGTSMAAPHAAGVLALMAEANGGTLDPHTAQVIIRSTAFDIGQTPFDSPSAAYTYDGEREGILSACFAVGAACP